MVRPTLPPPPARAIPPKPVVPTVGADVVRVSLVREGTTRDRTRPTGPDLPEPGRPGAVGLFLLRGRLRDGARRRGERGRPAPRRQGLRRP
ncbi:hypothetical protein FRAAL5310 [Frankia alni ACN14a]|uniref:Uncharacterized protein n=1 Tax=Frankia alni (strain DSM 45986 / CECT 9034 / ACN14a) TaxID=326424 RepID=Q0RAK4_FRAAA|nr:hypothetical protein FRAAL5310 [Frankia alni ACN14a]